jgi:hypothetical protein
MRVCDGMSALSVRLLCRCGAAVLTWCSVHVSHAWGIIVSPARRCRRGGRRSVVVAQLSVCRRVRGSGMVCRVCGGARLCFL